MNRIATSYWFPSSSSDKTYETLVYIDGSISCNCPGWTRRNQHHTRTCKHTRMVEAGIARSQATQFKDWINNPQSGIPAQPSRPSRHPKPAPPAHRKIIIT